MTVEKPIPKLLLRPITTGTFTAIKKLRRRQYGRLIIIALNLEVGVSKSPGTWFCTTLRRHVHRYRAHFLSSMLIRALRKKKKKKKKKIYIYNENFKQ